MQFLLLISFTGQRLEGNVHHNYALTKTLYSLANLAHKEENVLANSKFVSQYVTYHSSKLYLCRR